jgi:hypothetical protein
MNISDSIVCQGVKNVNDSVNCAFESFNDEYDRLTIKDAISAD